MNIDNSDWSPIDQIYNFKVNIGLQDEGFFHLESQVIVHFLKKNVPQNHHTTVHIHMCFCIEVRNT